MNTPKLIAVFLAVFAIASHAETYIITGSGTAFTATKNGATVGTADAAIQTVIDGIKTDAAGSPCTIQFGNLTNTLDIGTVRITFDGASSAWGLITLAGKITSAVSGNQYGTIYLINGASIASTADIANTSNSYAVHNMSTGAVTISGGTVSATTDYAVRNSSTGAVTISGGEVKATTGSAVYNNLTGKITVSGTAKVTSANTNLTRGTIYNYETGTIEITGGTVENTANNGNAIRNASTGAVNLGNSPAITGRIFIGAGKLGVIDGFSPGSKVYSIWFTSASDGATAVESGANYASNFTVYNNNDNGINIGLAASGSNLVFRVANGYSVSSSGTSYTLAKGAGTYISAQGAIDFIKTQSNGANCSIKFGDGTNALDISKEYITFDGASSAWGLITLAGKITSANTSYTIYLINGASIASTADIANTSSGTAVYNALTGAVTISGGTVSATTGTAVFNYSTGAVTISGGEVKATTGRAVVNYYGKITVSGTAKVTSANATSTSGTIYNEPTGTIEITGGTVENTASNANARAIYNASTGAVSISGGTVSATTGIAVFNYSTGKITVSGTAKVTSANTSTTSGTISIASSGTATAERLAITGGTVENTASNANARAIYNASTGAVTISGGKILAKDGYAVYKNSTGTTTLTGGTVFAYGTAANNVIYGTYNESGNPAIIAWDNTKGTTAYTVSSKTDIFAPSPTTAQWLKKDGIAGIDYANGENTGFIPIEGVTVKIDGLENEAPPKISISAATTQTHTYSLHAIALNKADHGELSYLLGTFKDNSGILAAKPTLDGTTLSYKGTGKPSGTATLEIIIASENYFNTTATITFEATPKEEVTITGITAQNSVYDGTPKKGYTGTAAALPYTGALVYEYAGSNHPQSTTPPTNVGEYTIRVTLPSDAPYTGEWRGTFTISKKQIAKPAVTNTSLVYTGSEQSAGIAANAAYTVTDDKGTAANSYTATVALKDKDNNEWADGTTTDLTLPWAIAANTPILPQIAGGNIRVQATANAITLENLPKNTKVQVYTLQGKQIYSANSENSQILKIQVQTKGMYIVKAGSQTLRVAVR